MGEKYMNIDKECIKSDFGYEDNKKKIDTNKTTRYGF